MSTPKKRKHETPPSSPEEASGETPPSSPEEASGAGDDKFTCPAKFKKCKPDYDGLCLEDLKGENEKEIWLIRAPIDFESSFLDGKKLIQNAQYKLGENKQFQLIVKESKQVGNITAVLPSKKKKKLQTGPAFKGLISVVNSVDVLPVDLPMSPPKMSFDIPQDLKQRFTPFGCGSPLKKRKMKTKCKKEDNPFEDSIIKMEKDVDVLDTSSSKKKKKKKDKKHDIDNAVEIKIEPDNESVIYSPQKQEVKQEVKQETYSDEADNSNIKQTSSGKKKRKKKHKKE
ncbi:uncharacterized protein [Antedon mediterranea]|uniref:uncharacterized protein n=1 Tax=Antedon mediterranea TaxID=105859 RepID=UPI003AF69588